MNSVTRAQLLPAVGRMRPAIQLSLYSRLILLLLSGMVIVCVAWIALVRQDVYPPNPFLAYSALFPGQKWNPKAAQGFICPQIDVVAGSNYCTFSPTNGPFWLVDLVTHEGVVTSVTFGVRDGAIRVGDLAVLWGKPTIQLFQRSGLFKWPTIRASADGISGSWGFSYHFPLAHITFSINTG